MTLTAAYRRAIDWASRRQPPTGTDQELLDRFRRDGDEDAFAELVRRHGPMVRAVCRRTLGRHDADDAFQATFLVLVRKVSSVRRDAPLANWLCGVAYKTARQALRTRLRRQGRERPVETVPEPSAPQPSSNDWLPHLDAAIQSLPDKYRVPLILCELEGQSRSAAASRLRLAEGTLSSRLARARILLRRRLGGRVVAPAVLAPVAVSAALAASTARAATTLLSRTPPPAGTVSADVLHLVNGVIQTMRLSQWKVSLSVLAALTLALFGYLGWNASGPRPPAVRAADASTPPDTPAASQGEQMLRGAWRVVSLEIDGEDQTRQTRDKVFVFAGKRVLVAGKAGLAEGTFRLHADRNPPGIDVIDLKNGEGDAPDKGEPASRYGIYKLEGDRLTLCLGPEGKRLRRPAEFATEPGSDCMLTVLERIGGGNPSGPDPAEGKEPTADDADVFINGRTFSIPVRINPDRLKQVDRLNLFVSDTRGEGWKFVGSVRPEATKFEFTAPRDGLYWFVVQTVDRTGLCEPRNPYSAAPALRVRVRQAPQPHPGHGGTSILAGRVVDSSGKKPPAMTSVQLTEYGSRDGLDPINVVADERGYFTIEGLEDVLSYRLTAKAKDGERVLSATVIATTPCSNVLLTLKPE